MVLAKWDFLIETSLGIGSICEKVAADTTLVGLVGRGISDPVLTPEMLSDRSSSDLISQQYNHPTNRTVRCPMRNHVPRKTSQPPSVVNGDLAEHLRLNPSSIQAADSASLLVFGVAARFVTQRISIRWDRDRYIYDRIYKTRTKIFFCGLSWLRRLIEGGLPYTTRTTRYAFYHVTISGHA